MSDMHPNGQKGPFQPLQGRRRAHRPISITNLPSDEELQHAAQGDDTVGTRQDRFPLHTPEQIEQETRTVRLDITFEDVVKIRDQCEMIMEGCRIIMEKTREHKLGSTRQRIGARQEAASLGRALARFNGKTPYGDSRRKPRSY
jgi:hypothetical protein